ncbi:MAG: TIGR04255 family protein [Cyanobacteria bacterium P01_D01_bin.115]
MGTLLRSQPLVEALCEFRFEVTGGWDLTLPGLFYAEVKDAFPLQEPVDEVSFQVELGPVQGRQQLVKTQRLQLWNENRSATLQIGKNLLSINQLNPYPGWEDFKALIQNAFSKYSNINSGFQFKGIALRYINHIKPTSKEGFSIDDYLTTIPVFPGPLNLPLTRFQQSYGFIEQDLSSLLMHRTDVMENEKDKETFILLDLECIRREIPQFNDEQEINDWVNHWLEGAHQKIESAFISSLNSNYLESLK